MRKRFVADKHGLAVEMEPGEVGVATVVADCRRQRGRGHHLLLRSASQTRA